MTYSFRLRITVTFTDWIIPLWCNTPWYSALPWVHQTTREQDQITEQSLFTSYIHCQAWVEMAVAGKALTSDKESLSVPLKNKQQQQEKFQAIHVNETASVALSASSMWRAGVPAARGAPLPS